MASTGEIRGGNVKIESNRPHNLNIVEYMVLHIPVRVLKFTLSTVSCGTPKGWVLTSLLFIRFMHNRTASSRFNLMRLADIKVVGHV